MPIPADMAPISISDLDEWLAFKNKLRLSEFRSGVEEWCEKRQRLALTEVAQERDCYKQHIQAQNPNKRIKIVAGTVQVQRQ